MSISLFDGTRVTMGRTARVAVPAVAALLLWPATALAHGGEPPAPHDLWHKWSWNPAILLGIALTAGLYARAVRAQWARAGVGRGVRLAQVVSFVAGSLVLFAALVSPLDALGEALFSAHMVQHLLLVLVAAPLLVLGAPPALFLWTLPLEQRRRLGGWWQRAETLRGFWHRLTHPLVAWLLYTATVWLWHAPPLYQSAVRNDLVHAVEHITFLLGALLFWWVLAHGNREGQMGFGTGLIYVFAAGAQNTLLGAIIAFAPALLYPVYAPYTGAWGLLPRADQHLAGLIMWLPGGFVYAFGAFLMLWAWLDAAEQAALRQERARAAATPKAR